MGIFIGTSTENQKEISIGASQIGEVYVGSDLVWKKSSSNTWDSPAWNYSEGMQGLDTYGFNLLPYGRVSYGGIQETPDTTAFIPGRISASVTLFFNLWCSSHNGYISTGYRTVDNQYNYEIRAVRDYSITRDGAQINGKIIPNAYTDIDGNMYDGTIIGDRVWTTSGLKTSRYSDGTAIPITTTGSGRWELDYSSGFHVTFYGDIVLIGGADGSRDLVSATDGWRTPLIGDLTSLKASFDAIEGSAHGTRHIKSTRVKQA